MERYELPGAKIRRWARLWGDHALRDRGCPIPTADPDYEHDGDGDESDGDEYRQSVIVGDMYAHATVLRISATRVAMVRIWAGVVPAIRSHLVVSNARKAAMPKAAKLQWVQCPCGAGPRTANIYCIVYTRRW